MKQNLHEVNALEWVKHFENRAMHSITFLLIETRKFPLEKRRNIVNHIKNGISEAHDHQNIPYAAHVLREDLIHDFWNELKDKPATEVKEKKSILDDFAVLAATNSPAFQPLIQNLIYDIVPEDMPEEERQQRQKWAKLMQKLARYDCCG